MSSETYFNATQAARVTGKSLPTIRKYLSTGRLPNAALVTLDEVEQWQIPLTDLVAAGLMDKTVKPLPKPLPGVGVDIDQLIREVKEQLGYEALQTRLAVLEAEARQLEARLADATRTAAIHAELLLSQTRQLEAGRPAPASEQPAATLTELTEQVRQANPDSESETPDPSPRRRSLFARRAG